MNLHRPPYVRGKPSPSGDRSPSLPSKVMSSDVIKEAKLWTARATVMTRRPSTPRDATRELFGSRGGSSSRPPSAISISARHFDPNDPESRPGSAVTHSVKLTPLARAPTVPANAEPVISKVHVPMPPSVTKRDLSVRSQSRSLFSRKTSAGANSPMKAFRPDHRGSDNDTTGASTPTRNAHSAGERMPVNSGLVPHPSPPAQKPPPRGKSQSATGININLAQLYDDGEGLPSSRQTKSSTSSSSSASSSAEQQQPPQRKRSGESSGQGAGEETADQAKYWNQNILPLLEALEDTSQVKDTAYRVCVQLHDTLERGNCIKNMLGRRKTSLLSTLFRQLNGVSTPLHLACARIILALRVRRQNLNGVCKILCKISREKKFDVEFIQNNLVRGMLEVIDSFTDPLDNYESLVYLTGAIKFLSDNKTVAFELAKNGCILTFISLLGNIMASLEGSNNKKKEKFHATDILIQATAVLRNMADVDRHDFAGKEMFLHLMKALEFLVIDETLSLNVSRLLSKLTMYSDLYPELFESPVWSTSIWNALIIHKKSPNVVIRMFFALGNVTAKDESARIEIHNTKLPVSGASKSYSDPVYLSIMNSILEIYLDQFVSGTSANKPETEEQTAKCLDTVNKIVRVIANLSISEECGELIASDSHCISNILTILERVQVSDSEELIINTLTTLNNLSYYSIQGNAITENRLKIAQLLMNILIADSMSCVMEASRVFGNISRHDDVRTLLHSNKIDLMMVALLDSGTWQMVYSACGVLINITASEANRACLIQEGVVSKLLDVLKDFAPIEWRVGGVASQLLWNLLERVESSLTLTSTEADTLMELLHSYLQEDAPFKILDTSEWDEDLKQYVIQNWRTEFCPFAVRLYKKVATLYSQLVPLEGNEAPSD